MNPAARQIALLDAQAKTWTAAPPATPVLAAGSTGAIPGVARLLRVIAGLPHGRVILPGLDLALPEPAWDALDDSHPQAGLRRLLQRLQATRGDVRPIMVRSAVPAGRTTLLNRALLPAVALDDWRQRVPVDTTGLTRLTPADQQEEALAIALILRGALETPDHRVALVTPDRDLAGRVAVELERFGVVADDSAGEPLASTPPAVFLRLLTNAAAEALRPVPLLALLKHPLAAAGFDPGRMPQCRPPAGAGRPARPGAEIGARRLAPRHHERTRMQLHRPA